MDRWAGKVVVVTGASAGIGLATAKALVKNGMIVIGLSRRVEKMQVKDNVYNCDCSIKIYLLKRLYSTKYIFKIILKIMNSQYQKSIW